MDAKFKALDSKGVFGAMDSFYRRAYDLMRSPAAKKAFDIESEPAQLREKYGRTPVGQGCLLARRLVEAGVRFLPRAPGSLHYHTHLDNLNTHENGLPRPFHRGSAALLEELHV